MIALDVAKYFIQKARSSDDTSGDRKQLSPLKLQKILYYAQGWYLANSSRPLFGEKIWAWKYGPVVREVYDAYHLYGAQNLAGLGVNTELSCDPNQKDREFLDLVWRMYGIEKADRLVDMTHNSDPWLNAVSNPYSDEISQEAIKDYFSKLLMQ